MSTGAAEAAAKEVALEAPEEGIQAQAGAQRAKSIATALPAAPLPDTDSDRFADVRKVLAVIAKAGTWAQGRAGRLHHFLSGPALLHSVPPTVHENWAAHLVAAGHHSWWWVRWPRVGWGCLHTALKSVLHGIEWVTHSPVRLAVAAGVIFLIWLWI